MRAGLLLTSILSFIISFNVDSQTLSGKVLNESGKQAPGVTVSFKNKANMVVTKADGSFSIKASHLPDTLVFSAVGMEPYKVVVTEKNIKDPNFEVVMLNQRTVISGTEVVVSSYSTSRRSAVMGYTSVTADAIKESSKKEKDFATRTRPDSRSTREMRLPPPVTVAGRIDVTEKSIPEDERMYKTGSGSSARSLTAGEVNDFTKWKMWEDYTSNEFSIYARRWDMSPTQRYSVQLTDRSFNAIVGEPVYLINRDTKDTVWKAMTDNTGKAELWSGFVTSTAKAGSFFIADKNGNIVSSPSGFEQGMNLLVADRPCGVTNDVDIAFVVDATGSMRDEIEFLKLELENVLRKTMDKFKTLNLKAASVFYRDSTDEYLTKHVGFNDDLLKAINFIKLQSAGGGGDYPEAVDDALRVALDSLQWTTNARTKLLFLVLDAPPHDIALKKIQIQIAKAAAMGIRIIPIACSGTDKSTEFLLRSMALATNGTYTFLTDHSGIGNKHMEPTTDKYSVELLSDLMERLIGQYLFAKDCNKEELVKPDVADIKTILTVKIYPNPTNGKFTIESNKDIKEIFVADYAGKILMKLTTTDKKGRWIVDIGKYPSGTYLVKYVTTENKWGAEKVILLRN